MRSFHHLVAEIKAELTLRGMQHSSLVFNRLAEEYSSYYQTLDSEKKEELLIMLRAFEKNEGLQIKFDWEYALSSPKK